MKTYVIELENFDSDLIKELMGFILTSGVNFRKLELITPEKTKKVLFVELISKKEINVLELFFSKNNITCPLFVRNDFKAILNGKVIGIFKPIEKEMKSYFVDNGKKFSILGYYE